jgi:3',5'-cyclic AMP phosphodiesterase CpdA
MNNISNQTTRRSILLGAIALIAALLTACGPPCPEALPRAYRQIVILGDPHLPGQHLAQKKEVRATINGWHDVDLVVAVGDICDEYGTAEEYKAARAFFARLNKPLAIVTGNHDVLYETPSWPGGGGYHPATHTTREAKLRLFRRTFHLPVHYSSRMVGGYLLVLLSTDHEHFATGIREEQLDWLRTELTSHPRTPTIIVFHGPLQGTQYAFKRYINRPHSVAQPVDAIHALLTANPQIFLWVSGHTHTPPTEESYASPINVYADQVTNIHNTDMKRETIWTNSLLLYPDRVVVRTFNHRQRAWQPELERTIQLPRL